MKYHLQHRFRTLWRKSLRLKLAAGFLLLVFFLAVLAPVLPLPYAPNYLDLAQAYRSPGAGWAAKHWLGTDHLGRDVLANLVFGFRTAFMIGLPVMLVTTFAGTLAGSLAAYYGNRKLRISRASVLGILVALFPLWFFGVYRRQVFLAEAAGADAFL
ncbi:MAG TPA: hypothetical protein VK927_11695, partial [Adhaeribacter sp.]|nr:hypothetical protein [Adhaeribacter sp.]